MSLVLWSGGCDSTLVLNQLLEKKQSEAVRALSVAHSQVGAQREQARARTRLNKAFRKRELRFEKSHLDWKSTGAFHGAKSDQGGLIQPIFWLVAAATFLLDKEDLYVGWVRGDDVWHYKGEIWNAFGHIQQTMWKSGKLIAPLEWTYKRDVLRELREKKLLHLTWSCENPKRKGRMIGRTCRKCTPCLTKRAELARM